MQLCYNGALLLQFSFRDRIREVYELACESISEGKGFAREQRICRIVSKVNRVFATSTMVLVVG
jgi:hypothetical protein